MSQAAEPVVGPSSQDLASYTASKTLDEPYVLGPDSQPQAGVPRGVLHRFTQTDSRVYPGTERDYVVYVPAQYDPAAPAALTVFQDGHLYLADDCRADVVLDNLIAAGDMPVTIGLFVSPGSPGPGLPIWGGGDNRSVEYDTVDGTYARLLVDELIPAVEQTWRLSQDPEQRAVVGISSGGLCAFNAAWERPDIFSKVVVHCGSFVNIRGGDRVPSLVRRAEPKPLRVALQTGAHDLNIVFGDWVLANRQMASALAYRGYDHRSDFGAGVHSLKHGAARLPDTFRWLWRDWRGAATPRPV